MSNIPKLQIALDYISLPPALVMAGLVAPEVDIIEIGTPLCKAAGLDAIRGIREICPDKLILADFKTPDVGGIEAAMAFDAGADMLTVIGGAATATIEQAYHVARERGKEMLMELTGVRDIIARATEWRKIGIDRIVYHREWDAQTAGRLWTQEDKDIIRQLIDMGYRVTVTGGLTMELIPFFADLPVSVLICGRSIREQPDPRMAAREIRLLITRLWSDSSGGSPVTRPATPSTDLAAKAIRWGISDMGLTLTVDGRECSGCNSPKRFCRGTRTEVLFPTGVDHQEFIRQLLAGIEAGETRAAGTDSPGSFYLDVGALTRITESKVQNLLSAIGSALQKIGNPVNTKAGLDTAHNIFME